MRCTQAKPAADQSDKLTTVVMLTTVVKVATVKIGGKPAAGQFSKQARMHTAVDLPHEGHLWALAGCNAIPIQIALCPASTISSA